ncbi:MAG: VRR-NUC domain-containing protein, partial [Treponema sp.]|nr:VRR-NUC domain-containing protein [Treponema sp.]
GLKGSSDILGLLPGGRFLAVECKAPDGRLSPEQRQFLADIKAQGGLAIVARSCRDIEAALTEAGYTGIVAGPLFGGRENG